jgi:quinol monooxygenase YgiN
MVRQESADDKREPRGSWRRSTLRLGEVVIVAGPVFFISHFAVKEGKLDELRGLFEEIQAELAESKPRTFAYLAYVDEAGGRLTILHGFADADAMDAHFEGADERSAAAYEFIEPRGWEIYGQASEGAVAGMRREAETAGVSLTVLPDHVGGFLRPEPA